MPKNIDIAFDSGTFGVAVPDWVPSLLVTGKHNELLALPMEFTPDLLQQLVGEDLSNQSHIYVADPATAPTAYDVVPCLWMAKPNNGDGHVTANTAEALLDALKMVYQFKPDPAQHVEHHWGTAAFSVDILVYVDLKSDLIESMPFNHW